MNNRAGKYLTGRQTRGGAAFNIINLNYDKSAEGEQLKQVEEESRVRALLRSKNIDVRGNCLYNPINGAERPSIDVPIHSYYNPPEKALQSVGASIMGSGFAGRPLRKELFMTPQKYSSDNSLFPSKLSDLISQPNYGRNGPHQTAL